MIYKKCITDKYSVERFRLKFNSNIFQVTISNNINAGLRYNARIDRITQRDVVTWLWSRSQSWTSRLVGGENRVILI